MKKQFFHFYFLNTDIMLDIIVKEMKFGMGVENNHIEGTVSQIFDLGLSFYFISKNG